MLARTDFLSPQGIFCKNDKRIDVSFLREIVGINSQTKNIIGVNLVQQRLAKKILQLQGQVQLHQNQLNSGDLLVGQWKGGSVKTVTLIAHADTVVPAIENIHLDFNSSKLVAPGIADNKSGLFVALRGVELFLSKIAYLNINLNFISSPNEEVGSPGFLSLFNQIGKSSDYLLGFEPAFEDGSIIHSRNGNRWYKLEVMGKSFHAGRAVKGHINVIHDLSLKIANLVEEFYSIQNVTFNVGSVLSGKATNVIPDYAMAKIDTRFHCEHGLESIIHLMEKKQKEWFFPCGQNLNQKQTNLQVEDYCPALSMSCDSGTIIDRYLYHLNQVERKKVQSIHSGGAADINHFKNKNNIGLDGLGAVGGNLHRKDEYVVTESIFSRSEALANFLIELNDQV